MEAPWTGLRVVRTILRSWFGPHRVSDLEGHLSLLSMRDFHLSPSEDPSKPLNEQFLARVVVILSRSPFHLHPFRTPLVRSIY